MKAMYALYTEGDAAQRAVNGLRQAGLADDQITVITGAPMEEFEFSHIGRRNPQWYAASAGGFVGLVAATWLTRFTELNWPINVGNMPVVAWWPNLIVMFELTMLGAIVGNIIALVVGAGLLRPRPALYDPEVSNGKILVGVENPRGAQVSSLEQALKTGPDVQLKTI
jgi:hypothetical protein